DRNRGANVEAERLRQTNEMRGRNAHAFREPALQFFSNQTVRSLWINGNAVADLPSDYIGAELLDFSGDIAAGNKRQRDRDVRHASARKNIEVIEAGRTHTNDDVVRAWRRIWPVTKDERVDATVAIESNCLHDTSTKLRAGQGASPGRRFSSMA